MDDVVGIRGLRVEAVIGVREHERRRRQPVELDVECSLPLGAASDSDELSDTVSYSDVARLVARVAREKPHGLLERLAADCVDALLAAFPSISAVTIEVRKPRALGGAAEPYVRLYRRRRRS